jgi:nitroreductase
MNNPTLELINKHASIRHYTHESIPSSLIETIIRAAQRASSSSNMQTYSVIAVRNEEKRKRLSELCANQRFIAEAPVFLVWIADLSRMDRVCKLRGYTQVTEHVESFLVPAVDCAIAAQNAAVAAESLGLGICYIGSIRNNPKEIIELLDLPLLTFPIVGMTLGWPLKPSHVKPRLPQSAILHWETYNPIQDSDLFEYDREMAATGIYKDRQVVSPGTNEVIDDYGWLEHSARRAARVVRAGMKTELKKQGFLTK